MNKIRKAVYAGSFDPPTNGHLWMIEQAAKMFDELIVAVGVNAEKKSTFSVSDRVEMLSRMTGGHANVVVESFENQFLVNYAASIDAPYIIRGLRNVPDFISELGMRNINADLRSGITTILLMPPRELAEVSSSLVKGLVGPIGWENVTFNYVPPVVFRQLIGMRHKLWEHLQELGAVGSKYKFWDAMLSPYMMPDRYYHNWKHIVEMLSIFEEVRHLADDPVAIELSIPGHDIVYNVFRSDNEMQSATEIQKICEQYGLSASFIKKVCRNIMATRHNPKTPPKTNDEKLFVDIDLSILGTTTERFDEYEEGIQKEYEHVPPEIFAEKRAEILEGFLARGRIFHTDYFQEKLGAQAEKNLKRSIGKLRAIV